MLDRAAEHRGQNVGGHRFEGLDETDVIVWLHRGRIENDEDQQILGIARVLEIMKMALWGENHVALSRFEWTVLRRIRPHEGPADATLEDEVHLPGVGVPMRLAYAARREPRDVARPLLSLQDRPVVLVSALQTAAVEHIGRCFSQMK